VFGDFVEAARKLSVNDRFRTDRRRSHWWIAGAGASRSEGSTVAVLLVSLRSRVVVVVVAERVRYDGAGFGTGPENSCEWGCNFLPVAEHQDEFPYGFKAPHRRAQPPRQRRPAGRFPWASPKTDFGVRGVSSDRCGRRRIFHRKSG
jgi:hypothetical protein